MAQVKADDWNDYDVEACNEAALAGGCINHTVLLEGSGEKEDKTGCG